MIKAIEVSVRAKSPLIMCAYPGELPSDPKYPRGKKTIEHIKAMQFLRWKRSAYFAPDENDGMFHIPPVNIEAMLHNGASAIRKRDLFRTSVSILESFIPLIVYDGPEDKKGHTLEGKLDDFFQRKEFVDVRGVCPPGASRGGATVRIDACRPIFKDWSLAFTIAYDDEAVGEEDLKKVLERGCIGTFRPRFGRFSITSFKHVQV
jgi:hypothetical protein